MDVVAVHVADETDADIVTHGYCVGPAPGAQALAPLLTPEGLDPIGIGDAARRAGEPVVWPRLVSEPAEIDRLAALADQGGPAGALHRLMLDASGVAVPMGTNHTHGPRGDRADEPVAGQPDPRVGGRGRCELAPQIALSARNAQLAARSRRNRQTLEGVIASSRLGVIVSDIRGRLSLANAAVGSLLGIDLPPMVGRPMRVVIDEVLKWRFTNPEEFGARARHIHADPTCEAIEDRETVNGRAIEYSSSPVRDASGAMVGRVDMLHDVTPARLALADARRLAAERAQLLEREERRSQEEVALTRAAHAMASALTPAEIHEILLDNAHALVPRLRQECGARRRPPRHGAARGRARVRRGDGAAHDLPHRRGRRRPGGHGPPAVHLQRHPGQRARVAADRRARGHPLVHARPAGSGRQGLRGRERQQLPRAGVRRARAEGDGRAGAPRRQRPAERPPVRAGAPHGGDAAAGAAGRGAAARGGPRAGRALPAVGRLGGGRRLLQRVAPRGRAPGDPGGRRLGQGRRGRRAHRDGALHGGGAQPAPPGPAELVQSSTTCCARAWPTAPW